LQFLSSTAGNGYGFRFHGYAGDGSLRIERRANATTWSDLLTITPGGLMGLGTMNPTSPLTVNGIIESLQGGIKFPDGSIQTTAGVANGTITTVNGNVGIGTSTPT